MDNNNAGPSRLIGPEDVAVGQYVTVSEYQREFVWLDCESYGQSPLRTASVTMRSARAGRPMKVLAVCLPFVYVIDDDGEHDALDLRVERLAVVDKAYGKAVFKARKAGKKAGK